MIRGPEDPVRLPELRPELQLLSGAPDVDGHARWLIHDPLMNRFIQIDSTAFHTLRLWPECANASELIERAQETRRVSLDHDAIAQLIDFLHANQLSIEPRAGGWKGFAKLKEAQRHSIGALLVHNYLFFRIPLCRPQRALERTLPLVRVLWSRPMRVAIVVMGLLGLYLTSRQWETFFGTLQSFFTWEGAVLAGLALAFVKVAHELGHAFTAVAFGTRVHTMGLAFILMAPMPYTDVTDAWRLEDRRQRLLIDSAGIAVEMAIAAVALFAWAFLPDGPMRSVAFVLSVVSAASSLAINLNPFMRFDGYYLLSEILGVENLQSRAFALGRWKLRELLFGLGAPRPEEMSGPRAAALIVWAWSTWVYRLLLFLGIALLVYHFFFKVLGIILFAIEIVFFIARPVADELLVWYKMRKLILSSKRTILTAATALSAFALCLVPWSTRVEIPAVVETAKLQMVYPVRSAKIMEVHVRHGASVAAGDPIVSLASSDIDEELARARISLRVALLQHGRRAVDAIDRDGTLLLESTIEALRTKISGLEKEASELRLVAPFDGVVADLNHELHAGRWISPRDLIAVIAGGTGVVAKGYVAEADLWRLVEGAGGVFIPEHPQRHRMTVKVERIAVAGATQIDIADLASLYAGRIAVNPDERRRLIPATAQYLVQMSSDDPAPLKDLSIRGVVLAQGRAESLAARTWRQALGVLVRESGF